MSILENGKILVTGGAGFIGSALIWALNGRGYENILVTDMLEEGNKFKNLVPLRFDDYMEGDHFLEKLNKNPKLFSDISCVIHLGAISSTTVSDCRKLIDNNYEYTKSLALWAVEKGIRFVYASSAATYGDGSAGMDDQDESGITALRPLNMYGYSKHLFDLYALRHKILDKVTGLKYFNVFGPNEHHKDDMRSMVNKAYEQISIAGGVKLFKSHHPDYEDGGQMRDFLYVKDAVEMTLYLAEKSDCGGLFNLGSGEANTWTSLITPIFEALNKSVNIEFIDMPEVLRSKYQYFTKGDISKLRNSGYKNEITPLSDSVTDYVKNYLVPEKYLGE